ncbi:Putative tyrosine-protein kinase C03B1.5 [Cytospora mali]|uniref:Tyrosine-protein kinase C03B1.5 n=1 Tax=Cytospora mali TaxID=578113 RepID=A0A194VJQ4_CYTMA|nr:Putative tyrosine-protein kinase C03B1.5 [Valsa mali]
MAVKGTEAIATAFPLANEQVRTDVCNSAKRALRRVHKLGILHGDIEMRNVMRTADNRAILVDFELARSRDEIVKRAQKRAHPSPRINDGAGTAPGAHGQQDSSAVEAGANSKKRSADQHEQGASVNSSSLGRRRSKRLQDISGANVPVQQQIAQHERHCHHEEAAGGRNAGRGRKRDMEAPEADRL